MEERQFTERLLHRRDALDGVAINFSVQVYNGRESGIKTGTETTDSKGLFTISGYNGERLSFMPRKSGYAIASQNCGGIYSYMWPEEQRVHPDINNPVVIKMWKLQGAEPLLTIQQNYKLPFTNSPIFFDLLAGKIVAAGGDLKITVTRPSGIVSERTLQSWSVQIEVVDGGLIESSGTEQITYWATGNGYQPNANFIFSTNAPQKWFGGINQGFYVASRNGQAYSKLGFAFSINQRPDDFMYINFSGVANTNGSRNWEGDPNTLKPQ